MSGVISNDNFSIRSSWPFLNSGWTFAVYSFSGKSPVIKDWLIIIVKCFRSAGDKYLSNLIEMPSWPDEVLFFKDFIILSMWSSSTRPKPNEVNMLLFMYDLWVFEVFSSNDAARFVPILRKKIVEFSSDLLTILNCFTIYYYWFDTTFVPVFFAKNFRYYPTCFPDIRFITLELFFVVGFLGLLYVFFFPIICCKH